MIIALLVIIALVSMIILKVKSWSTDVNNYENKEHRIY